MVKHESGMQLVASVISYIFLLFFSGKFAVIPHMALQFFPHMALLATNSFLLVVGSPGDPLHPGGVGGGSCTQWRWRACL